MILKPQPSLPCLVHACPLSIGERPVYLRLTIQGDVTLGDFRRGQRFLSQFFEDMISDLEKAEQEAKDQTCPPA